jgi:hypothetical protein
MCPGHNLVLLTASTLLSALLERHGFRISGGDWLDSGAPLPSDLQPLPAAVRGDARNPAIAGMSHQPLSGCAGVSGGR